MKECRSLTEESARECDNRVTIYTVMDRCWERAFPAQTQHPLKEEFSRTAMLVTRLYNQNEHQRFVQCANSLTQMHRTAQVEIERAQHRGAHNALRSCLDWVVRQGPAIDSNLLAQLLKHQMANFAQAERSAVAEEACAAACTFQDLEDHLSAAAGSVEAAAGRPDCGMGGHGGMGASGGAQGWGGGRAMLHPEAADQHMQAPLPSPKPSRKRRTTEAMGGFGFQPDESQHLGAFGPETHGVFGCPQAKVPRKSQSVWEHHI